MNQRIYLTDYGSAVSIESFESYVLTRISSMTLIPLVIEGEEHLIASYQLPYSAPFKSKPYKLDRDRSEVVEQMFQDIAFKHFIRASYVLESVVLGDTLVSKETMNPTGQEEVVKEEKCLDISKN